MSENFTVAIPLNNFNPSTDLVSNQSYDELIVDEKEISLNQILKAQERLIERLEREIDRLETENEDLRNISPSNLPISLDSSNTMPQGVILKSKFRDNVEDLLRQKAIALRDNK